MIKMSIINGVQSLTEVCDSCKCHVNNLTLDDILIKGNTDLKIYNSKGEEVTRKTLDRPECKCEACND
tara:strand:+ start:481 stop:684 length:204 start_codon:yes stop_codon:yes gene_type:complete